LIAAHTAQAKCARIRFPGGANAYRCASTIVHFYGVKLTGDGWHENPGQVGGTTYSIPQNYRGSILAFDADVAGMKFVGYTDNLANATAFEFESSLYSVVEDLMFHGGGGVTTTAHGLELRATTHLRNIRVRGFAGTGVRTIAYTAGAFLYGIANIAKYDHVFSEGNKLHGFHTIGSDVNAIKYDTCNGSFNGGAGFLDDGSLGNNFPGCHANGNNTSNGTGSVWETQAQIDAPILSDPNAGSYVTSSVVGAHVIEGGYTESGLGAKAHLVSPTLVVGGNLTAHGGDGIPSNLTATSNARVVGLGYLWGFDIITGSPGATPTIKGNAAIEQTAANVSLTLKPGSSAISQIALLGAGNLASLGLNLTAATGVGYLSADQIVNRNAAQTTTFSTLDATALKPGVDNTANLGTAGLRWKEVFAGTGTINTSDERHKTSITAPSDALLDAWSEVEWQTFQFKDAVREKGNDGARLHTGLVAQHVRDTLNGHAIDGFALGLLCFDKWEDKFEPVHEVKTEIDTITVALPRPKDKAGLAKWRKCGGVKLVKSERQVTVPKLDDKGEQVMRLTLEAGDRFGVRYEEALALEAALQRRERLRLEVRVKRLEEALSGSSS
jgi:hypothetical protein